MRRFCSPAVMWRGKVRFHSIDRVVEEIKIAVEKYHATFIALSDDLFAVSKKRLSELYARLKEEGLLGKVKFGGAVRANLVDDELCILLKKLGFASTATGYESGNEEMLNYLKAGSVTVEQNYNAVRLFEKYKLNNFGSFIFGSPGETLEQMKDTLNLIKFAYKHHIGFLYVYMMKPYPGTEIWNIARDRGLVSNDMDWELINLFISGIHESNKPIMMDKGIDIKEFKKIFNKALMYSRRIAAKRFICSLFRHPIGTVSEMGNPIVFLKKAMLKTHTLKLLEKQKGIG